MLNEACVLLDALPSVQSMSLMSEKRRLMVRYMQRLAEIAPLGYAVGTHIRFGTPLFTRSTMPESWQKSYDDNAYALRDPMVFWGISKAGVIRWSEITLLDPFGVITKAAEHGLKYGATASCGKITSRTLVGVARADREFDDDEIAEVLRITSAIHEISEPPRDLTPAMLDALRLVGNGARPKDAAASLGLAEDVFSARLAAAQEQLGVTTLGEALKVARQQKLL